MSGEDETKSTATISLPEKSEKLDELMDASTKENKKKVMCQCCNSYILQAMKGVYVKKQPKFQIPLMRQKKQLVGNSLANMEFEELEDFWLVDDMMTFENIGFTNTVDNKKYLICADCEIGPLGVQCLDNPKEFLLCIDRVKHVE